MTNEELAIIEKGDYYVIGLDQSYTKTGLAVARVRGGGCKIPLCGSINLATCKQRTEARVLLHDELNNLLDKCLHKWPRVPGFVVFERPRLFSKAHICINYLLAIGALNSVIVDFAYFAKMPCYSVDTRAWRAAVVGTTKTQENDLGIPAEKYLTVQHFCELGFTDFIKHYDQNRERFAYNHDLADAMGIACAPAAFAVRGSLNLLKSEY